jgi:Chaperone of endosialidase
LQITERTNPMRSRTSTFYLCALAIGAGLSSFSAACGGDDSSPQTADSGNTGGTTGASGNAGGSGTGQGQDSGEGSDSGGACSGQGSSCATGEACCSGLECCSGVPVPAGQEYCSNTCPKSDRNMKQDFASVDRDTILEKLAELPISSWTYKTEGTEHRHIGPMAQDFMAMFQVGSSDRTILQVDADGVALSAIQALYQRVQRIEEENRALRTEIDRLRSTR